MVTRPTLAKKQQKSSNWTMPWTKRELIGLGVGIGVIVVGYLLMSTGLSDGNWDNPLAVSVAPVVLVIGYCVIIPVAIMLGSFKKDASQ
ncbi:MAG: DUF3098 domain-containing protein [Candidatus Kapabacteria bacterium]|jgi:hypothetical protein|nr:DUF3098 domain-containing protein [Candidatus Kapabacteria bacterium]